MREKEEKVSYLFLMVEEGGRQFIYQFQGNSIHPKWRLPELVAFLETSTASSARIDLLKRKVGNVPC